jgi:hypothetical protein
MAGTRGAEALELKTPQQYEWQLASGPPAVLGEPCDAASDRAEQIRIVRRRCQRSPVSETTSKRARPTLLLLKLDGRLRRPLQRFTVVASGSTPVLASREIGDASTGRTQTLVTAHTQLWPSLPPVLIVERRSQRRGVFILSCAGSCEQGRLEPRQHALC